MKKFSGLTECSITKKIVLVCSLAVTAMLLGMALINWMCWYLVIRMGKSSETFYILGKNYYDWAKIGKDIQRLISTVCVLFTVIMGCLFVGKSITLKEYLSGLLIFFLLPLTVIYVFMVLLDTNGMSGGIETLIALPYRKERWAFSLVCITLGICIGKKHTRTSSSKKECLKEYYLTFFHDSDMKQVFVFTVVAIFIDVMIFAADWIPTYLIMGTGKSVSYHKILGLKMTDWISVSGTLRILHGVISIIFVTLFGIVMLRKSFLVKKYLFGIGLYFILQVWLSYFLNTVIDWQGMTSAVEHLIQVPFRYMRWGIVGFFTICGLIRQKKNQEYSGKSKIAL